MTAYLIKMILCSAVFYITYRLLLETAKMHTFNRVYLLGSLLLSFLIPLMTFSIQYSSFIPAEQAFSIPALAPKNDFGTVGNLDQEKGRSWSFLVTSYGLVTAFLLFRFLRNLHTIFSTAFSNPTIDYYSSKIVLINEDKTPHSFLKYMFIYRKDYPLIENEILVHEYAHIRQKHSCDVLFLELMQVFCWFNPFVFLYQRAVALNHEFLADDAVIKDFGNVSAYQHLLINKMSKVRTYSITSQFNYSITKKRLFMMSRAKSMKTILTRQVAVLAVLLFSVFLFSTKTIAQDSSMLPAPKSILVPSPQNGVAPAMLNEYEKIVNKARNEKGVPVFSKFSEADKSRLQTIYLSMSKEQQAKQEVLFTPSGAVLPRIVPTQEQIEAWKNEKVYGVWIDDKRVSNSKLASYKNTDFAQAYVSKLGKNTVNYGKHYYQVDLMTVAYYEAYRKDVLESPTKYYLAIRVASKQSKDGGNLR
jgi:bla regulator protein BlaR1